MSRCARRFLRLAALGLQYPNSGSAINQRTFGHPLRSSSNIGCRRCRLSIDPAPANHTDWIDAGPPCHFPFPTARPIAYPQGWSFDKFRTGSLKFWK